MKKRIFAVILLVFLFAGIFFFSPWRFGKRLSKYTPDRYRKELLSIQQNRKKLFREKADFQEVKQSFMSAISNRIFPYWYGTRWSFGGTTQTPGKGSVACGYFVTTVLQDAGISLHRIRLAQMPSETMIRDLVNEKYIQSWSHLPIEDFVSQIKKSGKGLYLVGLDTHTGFVLYDENGVQFIHASGSYPFCVINEKALQSRVLKKSKYRIVGKISDDKKALMP